MFEEVTKVNANEYVIKKSGNMNTDCTLYLNEKLLNQVEQEAINQIKNASTLPGIVGNAYAMPDMHSGYGAPIGCVVAFDFENGIISPGVTGFDINCLTGDSKILSDLGYYYKIKEGIKQNLIAFENKKLYSNVPKLFLSKQVNKIVKINTKLGYEIICSEDHPIFTNKGKIFANKLKVDDNVMIYPFEGVKYEKPKHELLLDKNKLSRFNLPFNKETIIKELESRNLWPLYLDSDKVPYLLKIIGFVTGDGTININNKATVSFYGLSEDLNLIRQDALKLGYIPTKVYSRKRAHTINTRYSEVKFENIEQSFNINSQSFASLLIVLGVLAGDKTKQDIVVPNWIKTSPLWYKRLYLASFFGAYMSTTSTLNKYNFYVPTLGQDKEKSKIQNLVEFLTDIKLILKEFNIDSNLLEPTYEYSGKKGDKYRVRLCIDSNSQNLINLFSKIGYEYNIKKLHLSGLAAAYLKQKLLIVNKREIIAKQAKQMHTNDSSKNEICKVLVDFDINERFIERSIWGGRKTSSRIAFNFESFDNFVKKNEKLFGKTGFCLDLIKSIKIKNKLETVYDFTMSHKSHNFVANNILVSNCGVRLLTSNTNIGLIEKNKKQILDDLFKNIPSGVGSETKEKLTKQELFELTSKGIDYAIANGIANKNDKESTEDYGCLKGSNEFLSQRAISRALAQIGTLGSGNHFLEVQIVDEIFDEKLANKWNLHKNDLTVMIHSGSRGFGHQIATDLIKLCLDSQTKYKFNLPDSQLACVPIQSLEGEKCLQSMNAAANFAYVNRQMMTFKTREVFEKYGFKLDLLYDVAHNIAKKEQYKIDGKLQDVLVHRKGATRAFAKGNKLLPDKYLETGQPVIVPGSMGTCSYVLVGDKAEEKSFGSVAHGAGRIMSRSSALRNLTYENVMKELSQKNIEIKTMTRKGILEEAPESYKDVSEVINVLKENKLAKPVVKLKPVLVMKG
ncbi:MAG: hypothetical protein COT14_03240 [Candidatus Diapherotrites archaeon CG08_land_8_20_14_0_20_30_16]|nr:MAG: hypothetical protein COT14_03240 [Candidatus Diapherotrites archaeon CG08_land_8_20_14_0_20_30_16]